MKSVAREIENPGRYRLVKVFVLLCMTALIARVFHLQYIQKADLEDEGVVRQERAVTIPAHRGMLQDRKGKTLAVSTPVESAWAHPGHLQKSRHRLPELAAALEIPVETLRLRLERRKGRNFLFLRRHLTPAEAEAVRALDIPGVHLDTEYRRYYVMGAAAAQLLGTVNIDDHGQEGLELAYDRELRAQAGIRRVRRDLQGEIVDSLGEIRAPKHGRDLRLSIDRELQYAAYQELDRAVHAHQARAGILILMDAVSGGILALAQTPSFNPNDRNSQAGAQRRARAITDLYEPGSVIKPFTVLAALMSGRYDETSHIDTAPGYWMMNDYRIADVRNFGTLDLTQILAKSSNVAAARIAVDLPAQDWWDVLSRLGFGQVPETEFPGAATGVLRAPEYWMPIDQAILGYGYGVSASALHLTQAFSVLANRGVFRRPSFLADSFGQERRVLPQDACRRVLRMLEQVTQDGGTAWRAALPGYTIAAKTGTVRKLVDGAYSSEHHVAMIAGVIPARYPRLVMLVLIDEPAHGQYFAGQVTAPVFQRVAWEAVRRLNIPPDNPTWQARGTFVKVSG